MPSTSPDGPPRRRTGIGRIVFSVIAVLTVLAASAFSVRSASGGNDIRTNLTLIAPAAAGGGWDSFQRELQQTMRVNGLVNNVQVVNIPGAGGNIALGQLTTLEDRLRTRFEGGLITDVQPPDLETRIAILMKKAAADGTQVDHEVLELIASQFESSIRELEGALIRVSAYSSLINEPITMDVAQVALRDILPDEGDVNITAATIKDAAAEYFQVSPDQLVGAGKTRQVAHARQIAMYLCRELTELSLPKIGDEFGGKDHTTVMYADRKIRKEMTENRGTYDEIQELTQVVKNRARTRGR